MEKPERFFRASQGKNYVEAAAQQKRMENFLPFFSLVVFCVSGFFFLAALCTQRNGERKS